MKIVLEMFKITDQEKRIIADDPFGIMVIIYNNPQRGTFFVFDYNNKQAAGGGVIAPKGADYELVESPVSKSILRGFSFHGVHPIGTGYELIMNQKEKVWCVVVNPAKYEQMSATSVSRRLIGMNELARRA